MSTKKQPKRKAAARSTLAGGFGSLATVSTVVGALSAALLEVQWWIEHNRESDDPMTGPGERAIKTRKTLLDAFKKLAADGILVAAPEDILRDASKPNHRITDAPK